MNIDDQNLLKRFSTFKGHASISRIDYIWLTNFLNDALLKTKIIEFDQVVTDHKLIGIKLDRSRIISQQNLPKKMNKSSRIKYFYEKLNDEDKQLIKNMALKELDKRLKEYRPTTLEEKWNIYNHVILATKKHNIEHKEVKILYDKEDQNIKNTLEYI
jgi:hypothetical protein